MNEYQNFKTKYSEEYNQLNKKYNFVSILRFLISTILLFFIYKSFNSDNNLYIYLSFFMFLCFLISIKIHSNISWNRKFKNTLISINQDEINYLNHQEIPFENGEAYINTKHFYSYDLDFFGKNSLFQNLNRTATFIGSKKLAELLLKTLNNKEIISNQDAINELSKKIEFRQTLLALAKITDDNQKNYQKLLKWSEIKNESSSKFLNFLAYLVPTLFIISSILVFTNDALFFYLSSTFFSLNLVLLISQLKRIKLELIDSDEISKIVKNYGLIIEKIENETFNSEKLKSLKEKLIKNSSSKQIKNLASLFSSMDSIQNLVGATIFNGVFLFHFHTLNKLINWRKENAINLKEWLEIIGEFESLNSLANFTYNNPNFIFPELNDKYELIFEKLGHPLIKKEKRIVNDVAFNETNFIILTGSNMSGKSTFLRTLGINMVLAGIGSPICASKATIHPLNVIVSMRQSDSLSDSESYFFAEVKRLKYIIEQLEIGTCFVLLDEILKGTNSDDKQTGTIEVIKKIISKNAIGAIATHDLEVCKTTNEYPKKLINKCFEVEIIHNELAFDYKLRNGICKNKSATFIMKKMEII